ncbi:hypothetical protein [Rhabdaerophilum sp. SD176]|uniref:hypothetical protein n=1 Tax=Rhabdaerophilum sp. SD176 TaxID=2983548 RepID=UPI0024DF4C3D|nr:hypothetical protein [Rhabdaerophilum sp. SD176]
MDTRMTTGAPQVPISTTRTDLATPKAAVRTDMAPPVAVAAQAGSEQARWNRERRPDNSSSQGRRFESSLDLDRETGDLVYRVIDPTSRATISQYPYEGLLRLRAYIKSVNDKG